MLLKLFTHRIFSQFISKMFGNNKYRPSIFLTSKQWQALDQNSSKINFIDIYKSEKYINHIPDNIYEKLPEMFFKYKEYNSYECYVAEIQNARVFGTDCAIITDDNCLLSDFSFEFDKNIKDHTAFNIKKMPYLQKIKGNAAVLTTIGDENYFHWLFDILFRLHLIQHSNLKPDWYIVENKRKFQQITLKLLNINKIIQPHKYLFIEADKLIVPCHPQNLTNMRNEAVNYLKNQFLKYKSKSDTPEKIYISRPQTARRNIENEIELLTDLKKLGFEKVVMENYGFQEQIALFNNAKFIIGPHGAAFSNLAFCEKNTKIVELFSDEFINPCFWELANRNNLDYSFIIGEVTDSTNWNYKVNINDILKIISK